MSAPRRKLDQPSARRPGDHYFVDVAYEQKVSTSGETVTLMGIALGAAPVPERRYVADVCTVRADPSGAKIIFGQSKLTESKLRSAVIIKMSRRATANMLATIDALSDPSYAELAERLHLKPAEMAKLDSEPEQVVALTANLAITAMSNDEVCIDFFQLSPFTMAAMSKGATEAAIDPVVRVDLHSEMFLGLLQALRAIPGINKDLMEA